MKIKIIYLLIFGCFLFTAQSCDDNIVYPDPVLQVGIKVEGVFQKQSTAKVGESVWARIGETVKDREYYINYSVWWGYEGSDFSKGYIANPSVGSDGDRGYELTSHEKSTSYTEPGTYNVVVVPQCMIEKTML